MSRHSQTYGIHWVSVVESLWKYEIDWHALCGYAPLCVVPCLCDRCMVPIPLRPALELNVLGAPGATSMTSCALGTSQDATKSTNQYKPVDIRRSKFYKANHQTDQTQGHLHVGEAWHRSLTLQAPGSTGDCHILTRHYTTSLFEAHGFPFFSRPSWMLEDVEFALPWMDTQIL